MSISITEVVRKSKQTPPALRKRGLFEGSESFIAKFAVVFVLYWGKDVESATGQPKGLLCRKLKMDK